MSTLASPRTYVRIDRGMTAILSDMPFAFDFFAHLNMLSKNLGRPVEVLEGGCGEGRALYDLKKGWPVELGTTPYQSRAVVDWQASLPESFPGLGNSIRTTGVTLESNPTVVGKRRPGNVFIGPIQKLPAHQKYDFLLDFLGPAFYATTDALPTYARAAQPGALAYLRLPTGRDCSGNSVLRMLANYGFSVQQQAFSGDHAIDVIAQRL